MGANEEGAILRMTLKPKSRVISVDELANMRINDPIANVHPELENLGRYATFRGYDVIDVGVSVGQPKYMVILNRTAVRVQDRSIAEVP